MIADKTIGDSQVKFLNAALARAKSEQYKGALIIAHHHPPYTASHAESRHGWSIQMLADIDKVCEATGVWPHAVLAGHVHNYQRFTRTRRDGTQIPYVFCGNSGHNVQRLTRKGSAPLRTPQVIQKAQGNTDQVVFENYDDLNYGYLRVVVTAAQLRIEYHAASDGPDVKAPDDSVTVDLATRKLAHFVATDLGRAGGRAHPRTARRAGTGAAIAMTRCATSGAPLARGIDSAWRQCLPRPLPRGLRRGGARRVQGSVASPFCQNDLGP